MRKLTGFIICLYLLSIACSRNEAEYYGYARKDDGKQNQKIVLSPSEQISAAIQNNDWNSINTLISSGLSVNTVLDSGRTLLNESVLWEREDIFKSLIAAGADPKIKDQTGSDTLEMCSEKINFQVLLDPTLLPKFQHELFNYLESEDNDELKRLLEQKLNANFVSPSGETPLTFAVTNNLENAVRMLLNPTFATNVHLKNQAGKSALVLSQELNLKRIEKILLSRRAQF
jgi:ankyrin repeat protein